MEVGLLVYEIYPEEVVDEVELLFVAHSTQLAVHFIVFLELDSQET
jgi:hypothetical protein